MLWNCNKDKNASLMRGVFLIDERQEKPYYRGCRIWICDFGGRSVCESKTEGFMRSPQTDRGGRHKPRTREERGREQERIPSHGCGMFMKSLSSEPEEVRTGEPRE